MAMVSSLRWLAAVALLGWLAASGLVNSADAPRADGTRPRLRRPVALLLADGGKWLFVANQRSGSISTLDTTTLRLVGEVDVGRRLAGLAANPSGPGLVAVDEEAGELVLLEREGSSLAVVGRRPAGPGPVGVQAVPGGKCCFLTCLWARQVVVVDLANGRPFTPAVIDLPFAPREQLLLRDGTKLLVADTFGGQLAVIDVARRAVESVRPLPGHNIRGLAQAADGKSLLVAHQLLSARASSSFDDVHWGNLLTNNLRVVPVTAAVDPRADLLRNGHLHYLGEVGRGAGDPAGVAVAADGTIVVALAGVNEIAMGSGKGDWQRLTVGRRPTAVVLSPDGRRAYVANTFSDSLSVVDLKARKVEAEVALGPRPELTTSDRGELLFHDARLSREGWFSCHSCHTDGHTTGLLNDNLSDGSLETPKRILSLRGVRDTGPWAWNGGMPDLESQVRQSVQSTMQGVKLSEDQVHDLAAYLRTLSPPPSPDRLRGRLNEAVVRRGQEVFRQQACGNCHVPPTYTSTRTYNVGLSDEAGHALFNPPSLRGVSQGGPFFHDNRAATLEEVFTRHRHQLKNELTKQDLKDLLGFLRSLE